MIADQAPLKEKVVNTSLSSRKGESSEFAMTDYFLKKRKKKRKKKSEHAEMTAFPFKAKADECAALGLKLHKDLD